MVQGKLDEFMCETHMVVWIHRGLAGVSAQLYPPAARDLWHEHQHHNMKVLTAALTPSWSVVGWSPTL